MSLTNLTHTYRNRKIAAVLAAGCFLIQGLSAQTPAPAASPDASANSEMADKTIRLTEVEVNEGRASALTQAPTDAKLDIAEPQSVISAQIINNTMAPTDDYASIANIAPSIVNIETEGPGLSESKMLSMRGFQDGQFNVTYDGIPFGDANGETHHTTSYFPAKVLGGEDIERGHPIMAWLHLWPVFDSLREDARFQDLIRRMDLPSQGSASVVASR